jgi:hypothetical protein
MTPFETLLAQAEAVGEETRAWLEKHRRKPMGPEPVYNCYDCNDSGYYDDDGPWTGGYEHCSPREVRCECGA